MVDHKFYLFYVNQARIQRIGRDITLVAHSIGVHFCVEAAEALAKEGISAEIINLRSIRPLDMDTINESIKKTHHLITVEGTDIEQSGQLYTRICDNFGLLKIVYYVSYSL